MLFWLTYLWPQQTLSWWFHGLIHIQEHVRCLIIFPVRVKKDSSAQYFLIGMPQECEVSLGFSVWSTRPCSKQRDAQLKAAQLDFGTGTTFLLLYLWPLFHRIINSVNVKRQCSCCGGVSIIWRYCCTGGCGAYKMQAKSTKTEGKQRGLLFIFFKQQQTN